VLSNLPVVVHVRKPFWQISIGLSSLVCVLYYCISANVRLFFVLTGSMEPAIPARSIVVAKRTIGDTVNMGQVVVFTDGTTGRSTAHRVIASQEGRYVTKGDANAYPDRYAVLPSTVLGAVLVTVPMGDFTVAAAQVVLLGLALFLGILLHQFLVCLKHGISCPAAACQPFSRFYLSGRTKKIVCGGQADPGPG
jgi:signal peptidase I